MKHAKQLALKLRCHPPTHTHITYTYIQTKTYMLLTTRRRRRWPSGSFSFKIKRHDDVAASCHFSSIISTYSNTYTLTHAHIYMCIQFVHANEIEPRATPRTHHSHKYTHTQTHTHSPPYSIITPRRRSTVRVANSCQFASSFEFEFRVAKHRVSFFV